MRKIVFFSFCSKVLNDVFVAMILSAFMFDEVEYEVFEKHEEPFS